MYALCINSFPVIYMEFGKELKLLHVFKFCLFIFISNHLYSFPLILVEIFSSLRLLLYLIILSLQRYRFKDHPFYVLGF